MTGPAWPSVTLFVLFLSGPAHAQQTEAGSAATTPAATTPAATTAPTELTATADAKKTADAAKPSEESGPKPPADAASIKVERTATGAKLFRITEGLVVEGQMQKPAAFYVLRRAAIHYDYSELGKSFLPKIGAAVKAPPF